MCSITPSCSQDVFSFICLASRALQSSPTSQLRLFLLPTQSPQQPSSFLDCSGRMGTVCSQQTLAKNILPGDLASPPEHQLPAAILSLRPQTLCIIFVIVPKHALSPCHGFYFCPVWMRGFLHTEINKTQCSYIPR